MKFVYLPYQRWDAMYDNMPSEITVPVVVGGNILACDFDGERETIRVVRGLECQIGLVESRMLHDDFKPHEEPESVLGTGIIANEMAKELIDEGKAIPVRPAVNNWSGSRRVAVQPPAIDAWRRIDPAVMRHDVEPKPKSKKKSKSRTPKGNKKRKL